MKNGAQLALGVAGGYLLGRTKKMRLALMLAGMAAVRGGDPRRLVQSALKSLGGVPEVNQLTGDVRGKLLDAGKQAAASAVSRQIESLSSRLGVPGVDSVGKKAGALTDTARPRKSEDGADQDGASQRNGDASSEAKSGSGEPERKSKRAGDTARAGVSGAAKTVTSRRGSRSRNGDDSQSSSSRRGGDSGRSRARAEQGSSDG